MSSLWALVALVLLLGGAGGLTNAVTTGDLQMPRFGNGRSVWRAGWLGNTIVGAVAALVTWGLYGTGFSIDVADPQVTLPGLSLSQSVSSILVGFIAGRCLALAAEKRCETISRHHLSAAADRLTDTQGGIAAEAVRDLLKTLAAAQPYDAALLAKQIWDLADQVQLERTAKIEPAQPSAQTASPAPELTVTPEINLGPWQGVYVQAKPDGAVQGDIKPDNVVISTEADLPRDYATAVEELKKTMLEIATLTSSDKLSSDVKPTDNTQESDSLEKTASELEKSVSQFQKSMEDVKPASLN